MSRFGLIAMGSSLDQIGPFTRTVEDAELLFDVIQGHDEKDATTLPHASKTSRKTSRVGVPRSFLREGIDADVLDVFNSALARLKQQGIKVEDVELPSISYALPCYYVLMPAEVSANLARFDGMRYGLHVDGADLIDDYAQSRAAGFGEEVRRRILIGTYVLSAGYYDSYYGSANIMRRRITADFNRAFETVDAIAMPTTPTPAFRLGEKSDPLSMYLADIFTVPANLTGMPALSVPMEPVVRDGVALPIGFQLTAPHRGEQTLFSLGKMLEENGSR